MATINAQNNWFLEDVAGNSKNSSAKFAKGKQDFVVMRNFNYFGRSIKRGSTFVQTSTLREWYVLVENVDNKLKQDDAVKINYVTLNMYRDYFVKQYE